MDDTNVPKTINIPVMTDSKKSKSKLFVVLIAVILGLGSGTGFLYVKKLSLVNENGDLQDKLGTRETETANLNDEITGTEQELAIWKATDLDKEAGLLRLKLDNAEKDLTEEEKKAARLETNLNKMKPYREALAAVDRFFSGPMTNANLNNIDAKISALNDSPVTAQWTQARAEINVSRNSWSMGEIVHTLFLIVSKIRSLAS